MKRIKSLYWLFIILFYFLGSYGLFAQTPVRQVAPHRISFTIDTNIVKIPYYRNFTLGANVSSVYHAVIVIHGTMRNANDYYNYMLDAAFKGRSLNTAHLIMAPQFLVENDMSAHNLDSDVLFWTSAGWKRGDKSLSTPNFPVPEKMSSFAVIDSILLRLVQKYSNLDTIIVVGHSAGGQFVQRFAAGSPLDSVITNEHGIALRYITSNPSSYVYLNGERRVQGTIDQFDIPPAQQTIFIAYNDYKYGLENLNSYMGSVGEEQIRRQYKNRNVIYLLGQDDNNPDDPSMDTSGPAMFQGYHRLERGIIYFNYLKYFYNDEISDKHIRVIVPSVAHDGYGMFNSKCGVKYIFNSGYCDSVALAVDHFYPKTLSNFSLKQNYPNPFNSETKIDFTLISAMPVFIRIYDITGRLVKTVSDGKIFDAGSNSISWNGTDNQGNNVCSGIYLFKFTCGKFSGLKRMVLLR